MLRLGGAFFLNPRCPLSRCRNEKKSGARSPHSIDHGLIAIRLIRVIRGLNILSFQLQNHSTSLMPIRVIEATERIARKKAECARRSVSFISAYGNAFTGSVQIRDNPCSPFHPCSTSTHDHCVNGLTQNSPCQTLPTRVSVRSSLMLAVVHFMHPTNH